MPRIDFRDRPLKKSEPQVREGVWRENMRIGTKEKEQVKLVEDWNAKHPVIGIDVIVTKDSSTWKKSYIPEGKSEVKTKTRSLAYMLGASGDYIGHTAVIQLDGISGCYALERVREVEKTCPRQEDDVQGVQ